MNKKIFIRTETSVSTSWADSLETLNTYYDGNSGVGVKRPDVTKIKDYEQIANTYIRIDSRMRLFKSRGANTSTFLSIGIPTALENQNLSHKGVDSNIIFLALDKSKYDSVHFGFVFDKQEAVNESEVVTQSVYFARNKETGIFEDVVTGLELTEKTVFESSIWFTVYRVSDTNIYYLITNTNLLMVHEDLNGEKNGVDYVVLNSHDGTFKTSVFVPSFSSNVVDIGDNLLLVSEGDNLVIDTLGNSFLHGFTGVKLPQNELPSVKLEVETNVDYTINGSQISIDMSDKKIAYIKYRWITNTPLDYSIVGAEALTYNFVIMKQ
jgi:hypothetical protein